MSSMSKEFPSRILEDVVDYAVIKSEKVILILVLFSSCIFVQIRAAILPAYWYI